MRSLTQKSASLTSALFQLYSDHPVRRRLRQRRNFRGRAEFTDRRKHSDHLLLIVAGHKPSLWPLVLPRVEKFTPSDWDVCLCCPGTNPSALQERAATNGWSLLHTPSNQLALTQNLAIARHPAACRIVKMDEDIFLAENTLPGLAAALTQSEKDSPFRPGLIAPLLNVNGFSARLLLKHLGRLAEFESRFGPCRQACLETPVWQNPEAARYLWEVVLPFDQAAAHFATRPPGFSACPHRFSIGCIALTREFWESQQGFTVAPPGDLGVEEIDLAAHCAVTSRPLVVAHHLLAGHAGFGHQMPLMEPWLMEKADTLLQRIR